MEILISIPPSPFSDNEADIELTRDEAVVIKKVGVRSFGIDDILNHTNSKTKDATEQRHKTLELRSPLDALFSLTTSFESMKQKSGKTKVKHLQSVVVNSACLFLSQFRFVKLYFFKFSNFYREFKILN